MGERTLRRILVADDEPDILEISRIALEVVGGFEVAVCASGSELLDQAVRFRPDLIVMDVLMPGMEGVEVLESLRRRAEFESVPVVLLTGLAPEIELQKLEEAGAAGVIRKPFDPMALADRLKAIWNAGNDR